ncbi:MAG: tRNA A-37 threonylcarbamoyl transferase component Bud32 [Planctomycetota bacterium]|jgi:tRNA A-37 threonylcarbamoyl transferase component Bud32
MGMDGSSLPEPLGPDRTGAWGWWCTGFRPEGDSPGALLEDLFGLASDRAWRRVRGRETFPWPGEEDLVVKRFQGGEARDWWFERLREGELPRSPGRREAENLMALAADGLPAPRAVAWVEEDSARRRPGLPGTGGRSALVMERIEYQRTLRQALASADPLERERLGVALLELVAKLHGSGWYHRDLYLDHVVQLDNGELCLLDLGRARRQESPRERWFIKDLAALYSSTPGAIPPRARLRFLARWLKRRRGATPGSRRRRSDLRRWSRVIQAKAKRLAQHAPRAADHEGAARAVQDQRARDGRHGGLA